MLSIGEQPPRETRNLPIATCTPRRWVKAWGSLQLLVADGK